MINVAQYYPFSPRSTMMLYDDVPFPRGLVYGALLYPRIKSDADVSELFITAMYTRFFSGFTHFWTVTNAARTIKLTVWFPIENDAYFSDGSTQFAKPVNDDVTTGYLVQFPTPATNDDSSDYLLYSNMMCCGIVRCAKGFQAYVRNLPVNLELADDALIFDPTTVRFRPDAGFRSIGEDVGHIKFNTESFKEEQVEALPTPPLVTPRIKMPETVEAARKPIQTISFAGQDIKVTDTLQHISIVAKGSSSIKVVTRNGGIQIGRAREL